MIGKKWVTLHNCRFSIDFSKKAFHFFPFILQLMPRLNETVGSTNQLEQHRALQILQQVIKALASKRLHHDRRTFRVSCLFSCSNVTSFRSNILTNFGLSFHRTVAQHTIVSGCFAIMESVHTALLPKSWRKYYKRHESIVYRKSIDCIACST